MKRLLLPLLTLFIVGCSGTAINKEGQNEVIKNIFEFQERLDRDGKDACESIVYEELKLRQKKLFLFQEVGQLKKELAVLYKLQKL